MSEEEQLQNLADRVNLGPHQHLIEVENEEGEVGRFIVHRPTVAEEVRIGVNYAMLRTPPGTKGAEAPEPLVLDSQRDLLAFFLATLDVVVDKRPAWCPKDLGELRDTQVVIDLFTAFDEWRRSFRRRVPGESGEDR